MKKFILSALCLTLLLSLSIFVVGCGNGNGSNETSTPHTEHTYAETVVTPTCTEGGYTLHKCKCGDVFVDNIVPALGHAMGEWQTVKEPTKTEKGLKTRNCTRNGCDYSESEEVLIANVSEGLEYKLNDDGETYSVIGIGTCTDSDIIIPELYNGCNVTEIGGKAFADCTATSIYIPDGIKKIGTRAFYNCVNITEIHIPSSVTEISSLIFYKASSLSTVYYDSSYSNSNNLFLNVENIKKIVFGGEMLPNVASGCNNITEVEILNSVTSIGDNAFV